MQFAQCWWFHKRHPYPSAGALMLQSFITIAVLATSGVSWALEPDQRHVSVLVHLEPSAGRPQFAVAVANLGGVLKYEYRLLPNVINVRDLPVGSVGALSRFPGVVRVEPDRKVWIDLVDSTLRVRGLQEQLTAEGLFATGEGVRVCICDTGINPVHIMYDARIDAPAGYDFVNDDNDPMDDHGHGSHVAGIAVGGTGLLVDFLGGSGPEPLQGIAPEATLIGVKVIGADGSGNFSDVIAGIDHCASSDLPGGPADVINLSLGDSVANTTACDGDILAMAANNAAAAGVVVVASSGNNGYADALPSPACGSAVIAVGATYDDPFPNPDFPPFDSFTFCIEQNAFGFCTAECTDEFPLADDVTCYSNDSNLLDVTAPGSYIWSAAYDSTALIVGMHGTSQAAPHVTGLAALILGVVPALSPATVRQVIRAGSVDFGPPGFDPGYGYGRIDVINSLLLLPTCAIDDDCSDGVFCNGDEICDAGMCMPGTYPCGELLCHESDDQCVTCLSDDDCDDDDLCNGAETCTQTGECQTAATQDCNGNGVGDFCDIADGTSEDCNADGTPDECQADCNDNDIADDCDITAGTSADCNENGVPDECDVTSGASADCNGNVIPDECELDCNGNSVPDECDLSDGSSEDCNSNLRPDECDLATGTSEDCNGNGIPDECDVLVGTFDDCNGNAVPDECEPPMAVASGARYVSVTPGPACSETPVALVVRSPSWPCLTKFIDLTGALVDTPVFHTPAEWGQVHVAGADIIPNELYSVRTVTVTGESSAALAQTWLWGDVDNNGTVNMADVQLVFFAFRGDFSGASLQSTDLLPCEVNRVVNFHDILGAVLAFGGGEYEDMQCPQPCD